MGRETAYCGPHSGEHTHMYFSFVSAVGCFCPESDQGIEWREKKNTALFYSWDHKHTQDSPEPHLTSHELEGVFF